MAVPFRGVSFVVLNFTFDRFGGVLPVFAKASSHLVFYVFSRRRYYRRARTRSICKLFILHDLLWRVCFGFVRSRDRRYSADFSSVY